MIKDDHRTAVDRLIPLVDAKQSLAVSWAYLAELIQDGRLEVYDITGRTVDRKAVTERSKGLRVFQSELDRFIDSIKVK
jgi:hypothetical protein